MSERSQKVLVWWGIVFAVIYGAAFALLLHLVPPPSANWSTNQIAHWYMVHHTSIRIGAVIASWTSAFMVPLSIVLGVQMSRQEGGSKIWSITTVVNGGLMSIFLVLPPLFFGVAAYTAHRAAEITATMHQLAMLTLVTTDQYYIFMWVAIAVVCFLPQRVVHTPFPRWYGYFNVWTAFMFEAGAIAFLPRTGPFAWNGLLVWWSPLTLFTLWIAVTAYQLLHAIRLQQTETQAQPAASAAVATA